MKKGVLIFAHNSRDVDYVLMAIISGGLAKKYLKVPASLITDKSTLDWLKKSKKYNTAKKIFENIIEIDRPVIENSRRLRDGDKSTVVPFINSTRCSAWDLTPYDRTLLIDSDFLIFSNALSEYWDYDADFMISSAMNDINGNRVGTLDKWTSDEGISLSWATTIMFTKTQESKLYFDLVLHIKNNYDLYSEVYRFDSRTYRNDIAFSIAKHILNGFVTNTTLDLPPVLTSQDSDQIVDVNDTGIKILINKTDNNILANFSNLDIHVMNKQSLIRNYKKLFKLI